MADFPFLRPRNRYGPDGGMAGYGGEARILRDRQAAHGAALDRQADRPQPYSSARMLVQVFDGGSMPAAAEKVYFTHPVLVTGAETEGGSGTLTVDTATTVPVVMLRQAPSVGDYLAAYAVGGRWVAEPGIGSCLCCPCILPKTDLPISYVAGAVNGSGTLTFNSMSGCAWSGCITNDSTGAGIGFFDISCAGGCSYYQATSAVGVSGCGSRGTYLLYEIEYNCSGLLGGAAGALELTGYACQSSLLAFVDNITSPTKAWTITLPTVKPMDSGCYGTCQCDDMPSTLTVTSLVFGTTTGTLDIASGAYTGSWVYAFPGNATCPIAGNLTIFFRIEGYASANHPSPWPVAPNRCNLLLLWRMDDFPCFCPGIAAQNADAFARYTISSVTCDPFDASWSLAPSAPSCLFNEYGNLTSGAGDTITATP